MTPSSPTAPAERLARFQAILDPLVAELEPLHLALNHATWQASVTGKDEFVQESARLDATLRKVLSRPGPFTVLTELKRDGGLEDPLAHRQLEVLINACRQHQLPPDLIDRMVTIEKRLDSRFNNFRARLGGESVSDNRLREMLKTSDDPAARREAWTASKQIGAEVESDLLELVRLRNQAARSLGFDNYFSMMLTLDELDENELFGILDELERGTFPLFEAYKEALDARLAARFGITPAELRPWHFGDPFFQEAPAGAGVKLDPYFEGKSLEDLTRRFFAAVGFDIEPILSRSDLHEKPGKSQHAFCISMDRAADVRVLCNIRSNEHWMGTMLHEFGHAVYDRNVDNRLPWLLRQHAHILTTEASAMLFGRLSKNATWLRIYAGVDPDEAQRAADATASAVRDQLLVLTRWCLVMSHMERALYRDPEQDLNRLWWDLVERMQRIRRPDGRNAPDWASKIHFSVAPVYYHNYMLGEMMASQLQRRLIEHLGESGDRPGERYVTSPEVGRFLTERLYAKGRAVDWRGAIRSATGDALQTAAFVAELSRA